VIVLAISFVLSACAGGRRESPVETALAAGDHEVTLAHGGRSRAYIVHVPPRLGSSAAVVLAFHGGGGEAAGFQSYAGLDAVADREGFVVVYPYGNGVLPRRLLTWNAGDCCGFALNQQIDDVGFAVALLDDLAERVPLDPARVYATGHSNGAMMAYRLATERSDRFAAVAPVAGAMSVDGPPSRAVAVLHIHSVDDPRALYEGGLGPPFPGTDVRSQHRPVESSLAAWVRQNGCTGEPRVAETRTGAPRTVNEGQTATLLTWDRCSSGRPVAHWKLTGVGHSWPGNEVSELREELSGAPTTLISAAEEAWRFFVPVRR
jgi:polyhydroxybutyrate depolymerase